MALADPMLEKERSGGSSIAVDGRAGESWMARSHVSDRSRSVLKS